LANGKKIMTVACFEYKNLGGEEYKNAKLKNGAEKGGGQCALGLF
jgi:hypothetical protein